jgi:hypothetical protein
VVEPAAAAAIAAIAAAAAAELEDVMDVAGAAQSPPPDTRSDGSRHDEEREVRVVEAAQWPGDGQRVPIPGAGRAASGAVMVPAGRPWKKVVRQVLDRDAAEGSQFVVGGRLFTSCGLRGRLTYTSSEAEEPGEGVGGEAEGWGEGTESSDDGGLIASLLRGDASSAGALPGVGAAGVGEGEQGGEAGAGEAGVREAQPGGEAGVAGAAVSVAAGALLGAARAKAVLPVAGGVSGSMYSALVALRERGRIGE